MAAPQVGVNVRLMVFNPYGSEKPGNESILVNPEVVESSRIKGMGEEGCLSFPRIYGDVEVSGSGSSLYLLWVTAWFLVTLLNCFKAGKAL